MRQDWWLLKLILKVWEKKNSSNFQLIKFILQFFCILYIFSLRNNHQWPTSEVVSCWRKHTRYHARILKRNRLIFQHTYIMCQPFVKQKNTFDYQVYRWQTWIMTWGFQPWRKITVDLKTVGYQTQRDNSFWVVLVVDRLMWFLWKNVQTLGFIFFLFQIPLPSIQL